MSIRPRVCVVVPTRNRGSLIGESLDSVLTQVFDGNLEVLVIDNCSTDDTYERALEYADDPRVTVVRNERDVQFYGSLNRALYSTTADYFVPFADDDLMEQGNIARKVQLLEHHGAVFAHSSARRIDGEGRDVDVCPNHYAIPELAKPGEFFRRLVPFNGVNLQSAVIRTQVLRDIGGFDHRSVYCPDWLAFARMSLRGPVVTVADPLVVRREHAGTGTASADKAGIEARDVPAALGAMLRDPLVPTDVQHASSMLMVEACLRSAMVLAETGKHRLSEGFAAYQLAGRAMELMPFDPRPTQAHRDLIQLSGLTPPGPVFQAASREPENTDDAVALIESVLALRGHCSGLIVGTRAGQAERTVRILEQIIPGNLNVQVAEGMSADQLFTPGRVAFCSWGSSDVLDAEARGVPVQVRNWPDKFGQRGNPLDGYVNPFSNPDTLDYDLVTDWFWGLEPYTEFAEFADAVSAA